MQGFQIICPLLLDIIGGVYRSSWKQKWFVLKGESLNYYDDEEGEGDAAKSPKKTIDLKNARGVRTKDQCATESWPKDATFCFGLATAKRTWYFYGSNDKDVQ